MRGNEGWGMRSTVTGVQDLKIVTNKNVHKNIKEKKTYTSGPVAPLSSV